MMPAPASNPPPPPAAAPRTLAKPAMGSGGAPPAGFKRFIFSGNRWSVLGGVLALGAVSYVPWYYGTAGHKQLSHQDYMEQAAQAKDEARSSRLSASR